jgi:hypothetical protein
MGRLERLAVRVTLSVLDGEPTDELIFCSRWGNVETLSALLRAIAEGQLTSPMAFSGSVHNAAPGLVGQIRKERINHTAIAAGEQTFTAGLIEGFTRLVSKECRDVTVTFADLPLPEVYRDFEDEFQSGIALAMRLTLAPPGDAAGDVPVSLGRKGVLDVLDRLKEGRSDLSLRGVQWAEAAR